MGRPWARAGLGRENWPEPSLAGAPWLPAPGCPSPRGPGPMPSVLFLPALPGLGWRWTEAITRPQGGRGRKQGSGLGLRKSARRTSLLSPPKQDRFSTRPSSSSLPPTPSSHRADRRPWGTGPATAVTLECPRPKGQSCTSPKAEPSPSLFLSETSSPVPGTHRHRPLIPCDIQPGEEARASWGQS